MRPVIVLLLLGLLLVATTLSKRERDHGFDARFDRTEERIRAMAEDIDTELDEAR